ncbi:creatininase family protein [bacterium]|nr:creatininase family protein [bacterium]
MRYALMLPYQIRLAIDENRPVVLPLGVLEYHSEHLGVGMDTLVVERCLDIIEAENDVVVLPTFYYGAASYAVGPPERNGSVQVGVGSLIPFARDLFRSLLRIGFRNIHFFIHHQSENFGVGMPTDLAFKTAARETVFEFLETTRGEGWWGNEKMADYYAQQKEGDDPFSWIQGHPLLDQDGIDRFAFDHAGLGETSLMLALCPEAVDLEKRSKDRWYAQSAFEASREFGEKGRDLILDHIRRCLRLKRSEE